MSAVIDRLSYSTVSSYGMCAEKVRLAKVEKAEPRPGWASIGGNAVHCVTEHLDLMDFGIDNGEPGTFNEAFDLEIEKRGTAYEQSEWSRSGRASAKYPNKEDESFWRENGPSWVEKWRNFLRSSQFQIAIINDYPAIEVEVNSPIGGIPNKGYIDRIMESTDGSMRLVVDLKSGARIPSHSTQLRVYGKLLRAVGTSAGYGAYFMCRTSELTTPVALSESDDADLDYLWSTTMRGIQSEIFVPSPGPMCSSCDVRDYCRSFDGQKAGDYLPY